jgi:hypothetical protein
LKSVKKTVIFVLTRADARAKMRKICKGPEFMRSLLGARALMVLAALGWSVAPVSAESSGVVISSVGVGSHEGRLQVEIRSSEPVSYLLSEQNDPFRVTLYFLNASFGFPPGERLVEKAGLSAIVTSVVEREGSRLGRVDLRFAETVPYRIVQERNRLLVRADLPAPSPPLTVLPEAARPEAEISPQKSRPPAHPADQLPTGISLILNVVPESHGGEVRVFVDADGPLAFKSFTMSDPFRIVVDFEGALSSLGQETLPVSGPLLKRIRTSQHKTDVARIVLDLARPSPFWVERKERGVVVHLGTRGPQ